MKKYVIVFALVQPLVAGTTYAGNKKSLSETNPKIAFDSKIPKTPVFESNELNTLQLLPKPHISIAVRWGIPDSFVSRDFAEKGDALPRLVWGTRETLDQIEKDPTRDLSNINTPVFLVEPSMNVAQKNLNDFVDEEKALSSLKENGFKVIESKKLQWGIYPVLTIEASKNGRTIFLAYVGANYEGWALKIDYRPTKRDGTVPDEDRKLWNNLLTETQMLPEPWLSRALGYDRYWGATFVRSRNGLIYKVSAQKRLKDQMIGIRIEPIVTEAKEIKAVGWDYTSSEKSTLYNSDSVTVEFNINYLIKGQLDKVPNLSIHTPAVLLTEVDEFSLKGKPEKKGPKVLLFK